MPRQGALSAVGPERFGLLNHTTFQLLGWTSAAGSAVVVEVVAPDGAAAGLALVGRIGGEEEGEVGLAAALQAPTGAALGQASAIPAASTGSPPS